MFKKILYAGAMGLMMGYFVWGWVRASYASDDLPVEYLFEWERSPRVYGVSPLLDAKEAFERSNSALQEMGALENPNDAQIRLLALSQLICEHPLQSKVLSRSILESRLSFLDPLKKGSDFFEFGKEYGLIAYLDPVSKTEPFWTSECLPAPTPLPKSGLKIAGLKIAIDPGHMGGSFWDGKTGKYVSDGTHKISEGVLNLQTALLLKRELEALGAEVMLTHENIGAVHPTPLDQLDLDQWGKRELAFSQYEGWYQQLLTSGRAGSPELFRAFKNSAQIRALFSESTRTRYFIKRADLEIRSERMLEFKPDLSIVIHYNTSGRSSVKGHILGENPMAMAGYARTMAFVPGAMTAQEFSGVREIESLLWHVAAPEQFENSVRLSRAITGQLSKRLGIPLAMHATEESKKVEAGVFSRNLVVSRRLHGQVQTFLEVFHYDDPTQFKKLLSRDHELVIGNQVTHYSNYLVEIVHAIKDGVIEYTTLPASE